MKKSVSRSNNPNEGGEILHPEAADYTLPFVSLVQDIDNDTESASEQSQDLQTIEIFDFEEDILIERGRRLSDFKGHLRWRNMGSFQLPTNVRHELTMLDINSG